jgi:hypothetical protein
VIPSTSGSEIANSNFVSGKASVSESGSAAVRLLPKQMETLSVDESWKHFLRFCKGRGDIQNVF